jgi:hypothetical protein
MHVIAHQENTRERERERMREVDSGANSREISQIQGNSIADWEDKWLGNSQKPKNLGKLENSWGIWGFLRFNLKIIPV